MALPPPPPPMRYKSKTTPLAVASPTPPAAQPTRLDDDPVVERLPVPSSIGNTGGMPYIEPFDPKPSAAANRGNYRDARAADTPPEQRAAVLPPPSRGVGSVPRPDPLAPPGSGSVRQSEGESPSSVIRPPGSTTEPSHFSSSSPGSAPPVPQRHPSQTRSEIDIIDELRRENSLLQERLATFLSVTSNERLSREAEVSDRGRVANSEVDLETLPVSVLVARIRQLEAALQLECYERERMALDFEAQRRVVTRLIEQIHNAPTGAGNIPGTALVRRQ